MKIRNNTAYVYDIEVFKNVFHCTLLNTETEELIKFECSIRKNEIEEMCKFFLQPDICLVGYNNIHYDNPIINYCIEYFSNSKYTYDKICISIFNLSTIITQDKENIDKWKRWKYANNFYTLDLLTMLYSQALRVSLKEMQVTMMYKNVQEFNCNWQIPLATTEIDSMIDYNINDVMSTYELLKRCEKDIKLRLDIEDQYNIKCLSKDGVNIGMQILAEEYMRKTGISWNILKDLRSPADTINLNEIILPFIKYDTKILQDLLTEMKSLTVSPGRKSYEKKFLLGDRVISVGVGGIHTINESEIIIPNENEILVDLDVASLYPSMLLNFDFYPRHLGKEFKEVYADIRERRIKAKHAKDKVTDATLKLALNGLSGNLQNEFSWCYDPKAVMGIRINGQLLLLMLTEKLMTLGVTPIQLNTDGIFVKMPKSVYSKAIKICKEWENLTGLILEEDRFKAFYQLAVNDYFGVFENNLIKEKGCFITSVIQGKGLTPKIIPKAVEKYFLEGIKPEEFIKQHTDIKDFLMSEKTGKQWTVEYNGQTQQRTNRFYASTDGCFLYKWKIDNGVKKYQNMLTASGVTLLNNFDNLKENPKINYQYYITEANKIINQLKTKQLSLF
jgi:hypothetical protein|nr:MAG TPA: DNA polymerase [Bacteriophage sp.]